MASVQLRDFTLVDTIELAKTSGNFKVGEWILCKENHGIYVQMENGVEQFGGYDVVDNLLSDSSYNPLSAGQGKILYEYITRVDEETVKKDDIVDDLISNDSNKVLSANQGYILGNRVKTLENEAVRESDIIDDVVTEETNKALSANQGKWLNDRIIELQDKDVELGDTLRAKINISDIVDNLDGASDEYKNKPLSAYQGYALATHVRNLQAGSYTELNVANNLDTPDSVTDKVLDARQGRILNELKLDKVDLPKTYDDLTHASTTDNLSANQGVVIDTRLNQKVNISDIQDNLISSEGSEVPLSAKQGYELDQKVGNVQSTLEEKIKALGDALYAEGYVVEGCSISYNSETKVANCDGGRIVLNGLIYSITPATITITSTDPIQIGIWRTIASDGTSSAEWGLSLDKTSDENNAFLPMYGVSNGEVITGLQNTSTSDYAEALARYDNNAHGSYVADGLTVTALETEDEGKQVYSISEGTAHINGYVSSIAHSERLVVDENADIGTIKSEVHRYTDDGTGKCEIEVYQKPIEEVLTVRIAKSKTTTMQYLYANNNLDPIPDTSVVDISEIRVGSTIYVKGTDYELPPSTNRVSWLSGGNHPSDGTSYTITYTYMMEVTPTASTTTTITVSGAVDNSYVQIDYTYRMPRKDLIVMYKDGSFGVVKGVPHRYDPVLPSVPPDSICLAEVTQSWFGLPTIVNNSIQVVHMEKINTMSSQIINLYDLVARNEQRFEALVNAPASVSGVFVDPLFDDTMRDTGTTQTALIANETLQLPIELGVKALPTAKSLTLDYSNSAIISQEMHTKEMQVNPYQAFSPMPVEVSLSPSVDRWSTTTSKSVITQTISFNSRNARRTYDVLQSSSSTTTQVSGTLRQISVTVTASGFGANEPIYILFDGVRVTASSTSANSDGNFTGSFTIPSGIPTGTKLVTIQGTHNVGYAYFVGIQELKTTINYYVRYNDLDPLSQTFTLPENRHISGVEFYLTAKSSSSDLRIEIRETNNGMPTSTVLASCRVKPSALRVNAWNTALFDTPIFLSASSEYAITVMADTSEYKVGIAELGDWDSTTGWIRSQPYSTGVLLSSSNASTWTAHQSADMAFRLLGANFTNSKKTITLGTVDLTGVTDILPLAEVEKTGADADVVFVLKKGSDEIARMQTWQPIMFDDKLNGNYIVEAELVGDSKFSPILSRDPQLITGKMDATGDYVSRAFACGTGKKIMVTTVEYLSEYNGTDTDDHYDDSSYTSSIRVSVETSSGNFTTGVISSIENMGDGWYKKKRYVNCNLPYTRIKIDLRGSSSSRPYVQTISAVVLDA